MVLCSGDQPNVRGCDKVVWIAGLSIGCAHSDARGDGCGARERPQHSSQGGGIQVGGCCCMQAVGVAGVLCLQNPDFQRRRLFVWKSLLL